MNTDVLVNEGLRSDKAGRTNICERRRSIRYATALRGWLIESSLLETDLGLAVMITKQPLRMEKKEKKY
uniref:Uncharacterized protein n=1 Tax=Heterorhabditis bacteriophora TaxID=37862 RepID=A0A1I7X329_HETBA